MALWEFIVNSFCKIIDLILKLLGIKTEKPIWKKLIFIGIGVIILGVFIFIVVKLCEPSVPSNVPPESIPTSTVLTESTPEATLTSESAPTSAVPSESSSTSAVSTEVPSTISTEPSVVPVPDVKGLTAVNAEMMLKNQGFIVERGVDEYSDTIPAGTVISQSVSGSAAQNTTIIIVISKGKEYFTVSFNSNGGSQVSSQSVQAGSRLNNLPVPSKDYCTFIGWKYSGQNAENITIENDIILEADWELKPESDWVLTENVPQGAQITDSKMKYIYTMTTTVTNTSPSMEGYTLMKTEPSAAAKSSETIYYASFPAGFNTGDSLYNKYPNRSLPADWENEYEYHRYADAGQSSYIYYHWAYNKGTYGDALGNMLYRRAINQIQTSNCGAWGAFESTADYGMEEFQGESVYKVGYDKQSKDFVLGSAGAQQWTIYYYRVDVMSAIHMLYDKQYVWSKTESGLTSETDPSGQSGVMVTEKQEWVKYREK